MQSRTSHIIASGLEYLPDVLTITCIAIAVAEDLSALKIPNTNLMHVGLRVLTKCFI